jgi:hypothetical protein
MADNLTVTKHLEKEEIVLLTKASKTSQAQNRSAEEFKEMLIARNCISSFDSYLEFMDRKELVSAIRLCWRLGYDETVHPSNLSGGLMSDFDFIQVTPKKSLQDLVTDENMLKKLVNKRTLELQRIARNVDAFIRNMGWIEGPPAKKRKAPVSKVQLVDAIQQKLTTATAKNASAEGATAFDSVASSVTGTSSLGKSLAKACISDEADEEDMEFDEHYTKPSNEMMDSDSEHEPERTNLTTLMKNVNGNCSVVVFRDPAGAIKTKKLTAKSTKIVKEAVTEEVTFWSYYWSETKEPMTEEEYLQHLEAGGDEAEVEYI